jgi:hypothetical protein
MAGVVAAVALAWGALWLARPGQEGAPTGRASPSTSALPPSQSIGVAALHGFGDTYLCPFSSPYRGYQGYGHLDLYPPNHPLAPGQDIEPERCFASVAEGLLVGYGLVPPPPGAVVVDGVYLVTVDTTYWNSICDRAAAKVGFPVPCPVRLPNVPVGGRGPRCQVGFTGRICTVWGVAFDFEETDFAVPPEYPGGSVGGGPRVDLTIAAYPKDDPGLAHDFEYLFDCRGGTQRGTTEVLGFAGVLTARLTACPADVEGSLLAGDQILTWETDGIVYVVAVAGDADTTVLLLRTIAGNLRLVEPPA